MFLREAAAVCFNADTDLLLERIDNLPPKDRMKVLWLVHMIKAGAYPKELLRGD